MLLNDYYHKADVRQKMEKGLLARSWDFIIAELERQGYSRQGIRRRLHAADVFAQWLAGEGLSLADITDSLVNRYIAGIGRRPSVRRRNGVLPHNGRGIHQVADLLRKQGVAPPEPPRAPVPCDDIDAYLLELRHYMERVMGAASNTCRKCLPYARLFLKATFPDSHPQWSLLKPHHVSQFIQQGAEKLAPASRKGPMQGVQVLLRFLVQKGELPGGFEGAIPSIRQWRHATLPRHIASEEVERVLASCQGANPKARRDRAMLLLLARLGLHPGEVTRLCVDHIDWRNGHVLVRAGKTCRERLMPMPEDVGVALMEYAVLARPRLIRRRPDEEPAGTTTYPPIGSWQLRHAGNCGPRQNITTSARASRHESQRRKPCHANRECWPESFLWFIPL